MQHHRRRFADLLFLDPRLTPRISRLPDAVGTLFNLRELFVSNNRLVGLPEAIGRLRRLEIIRATNNHIDWLPPAVGQLTALRRLHLGRNRLMLVPKEVCRLPLLEELFLGRNQLRHLPEELGSLRRLEKLHVQDNLLWRLPDSVGLLNKLRVLKFTGNKIKRPVPGQVQQIPAQLRYFRARMFRASWSLENHSMFCSVGSRWVRTVLLCARRGADEGWLAHLPLELWLLIWAELRGSDILQEQPARAAVPLPGRRRERQKQGGGGGGVFWPGCSPKRELGQAPGLRPPMATRLLVLTV